MSNLSSAVLVLLLCITYLFGKIVDAGKSDEQISVIPNDQGVFIVKHESKQVHFCTVKQHEEIDFYVSCNGGDNFILP